MGVGVDHAFFGLVLVRCADSKGFRTVLYPFFFGIGPCRNRRYRQKVGSAFNAFMT